MGKNNMTEDKNPAIKKPTLRLLELTAEEKEQQRDSCLTVLQMIKSSLTPGFSLKNSKTRAKNNKTQGRNKPLLIPYSLLLFT